MGTYAKWTRSHGTDDAERWTETQHAPTLNGWEERHEVSPVLVIPEPSALAGTWTQLDLFSAASPARTFPWQASGPVYPASAAVYGLNSDGLCPNCGHAGWSLRMFQDCSTVIAGATSVSFSGVWPTSGMGGPTGFWTRAGSERPNVVVESSLSAVLETSAVPQRYWVSAKAAAGILRRSIKRKKVLPRKLEQALMGLASALETKKATVAA
jgi:hypothetical protein